MIVKITAPHGLEISAQLPAASPDGMDTSLRQIAETYERLVRIDIAEGLANAYVLAEEPEVETELGDGDEDGSGTVLGESEA